eukprot:SAG31_NODE_4612_length_3097_cov_2.555704_1_plen_144_part_00
MSGRPHAVRAPPHPIGMLGKATAPERIVWYWAGDKDPAHKIAGGDHWVAYDWRASARIEEAYQQGAWQIQVPGHEDNHVNLCGGHGSNYFVQAITLRPEKMRGVVRGDPEIIKLGNWLNVATGKMLRAPKLLPTPVVTVGVVP